MTYEACDCVLCCQPAQCDDKPFEFPRRYRCIRCGSYSVDHQFLQHHTDGVPIPELSGLARTLSDQADHLIITHDNIQDYIRRAPRTVMEKLRSLLQAVSLKSREIGEYVPIDCGNDYPLAYCKSPNEFTNALKYMKEMQLIEGDLSLTKCKLTMNGWNELEKLPLIRTNKAFVAMWFDVNLKFTFDNAIKPAISRAGYNPVRVDQQEHVGKIDDFIMAEIQESRFVVADFTGHRSGVYFEAGYALGLGIPVVWTCRDDHMQDLHFDIRQYNCIVWKASEFSKFQEDLHNRIRAIIGFRE